MTLEEFKKQEDELRNKLVLSVARYYIDNKSTTRKTAEEFNLSKSTVHNYLTVRLKKLDKSLYEKVLLILETNKMERGTRGGNSYRIKCEEKRARKYP